MNATAKRSFQWIMKMQAFKLPRSAWANKALGRTRATNTLTSVKRSHPFRNGAARRLRRAQASSSSKEAAVSECEPSNSLQAHYQYAFETSFEWELEENLLQQIRELPGTQDWSDYVTRTINLTNWKHALEKGCAPASTDLIDQLLQNSAKEGGHYVASRAILHKILGDAAKSANAEMLELVHSFETALMEMENDSSAKTPPSNPSSPSQSLAAPQQNGTADDGSQQMQGRPEGQENKAQSVQSQTDNGGSGTDGTRTERMQEEMDRIAEEIVSQFEEEMAPVMDSLEKAQSVLQDLDVLMDQKKGFNLSSGLWKRSGWQEMDNLRRKLEDLKELRELVRSLGRAGGRGPKRRAPAQIWKSGYPPGVIRSALQPEETTGLCRSGDLSRMLPSESALMAAGWPKNSASKKRTEKQQKVSRAVRLLHLARRAERNLLSYERSGWLEDEPSRVLHCLEYRPAAEQGPIIVCLDTSGSMQGVRETVAKALVLECLRGAHRQGRACYLYAFGSYRDLREIELAVDQPSLAKLLDFLEHAFNGGTDVTRALELSIERVRDKAWAQADILIATDGEMRTPNASVLQSLAQVRKDLGLEVHGLLVGNSDSEAMAEICTHLHVFRKWDAARRR